MEKYYLEETKDVLKSLNTSENGLSSNEASIRLEKNGKNKLKEAEKETLFQKYLNALVTTNK